MEYLGGGSALDLVSKSFPGVHDDAVESQQNAKKENKKPIRLSINQSDGGDSLSERTDGKLSRRVAHA